MNKLILTAILMIHTALFAQEGSGNTALLLIDIQEFYFPGGKWELTDPTLAAKNASLLLEDFRKDGKIVIHVRHDTEPGGNIHELVKPLSGEKIFTKKEVNAFKDTGLLAFLKENKITSLVICGMQTHMCLEAATRAASDYGFSCIVVGDACATRDLTFGERTVTAADVHAATLSTLKSYAEVTDVESYLMKNN